MVGATRLPAGPTVRADPFILRALNNSQQSMLVGRQGVASLIIDQMTHGTPAVHLIVGPSGSGRTSLLNCLAPEDSRHIGNIWNEETKTTGVIHEAVAKFTNQFQIPPTPQSAADYLRRHLEGRTGHLDLIAFDYPYIPTSDLLAIVQNIVPALQTMRAMTVVSMSDAQYRDLGQSIEGSFEWIHHLSPLSLEETRTLVDLRMNSVSNEVLLEQGEGISRLHAYTGGNPKEIVRQCGLHLRHLRFPDQYPLDAPFMNQQLPISPSIQSNIGSPHSSSSRMGPRPEPQRPLFPSTTVVPVQEIPPHSHEVNDDGYDAWFADSKVENQLPKSFDSNHIEVSSVDINDDNRPLFESIDDDPYGGIGFDPEVIHIADQDEVIDFDESQVLYLETEEMESELPNMLDQEEEVFDDSYEATGSNDSELLSMDSGPVSDIHTSDMYAENDVNISSEPIGLEPSSDFELLESEVTIQSNTVNLPRRPRSGISGLADRMREANVRMDLAPRAPPTEIIEAIDWGPEEESKDDHLPPQDIPESTPVADARPQMRTIDPMTSRPPDIDEDGAQLWTDPSLSPSPPPAVPDYSPTPTPIQREFTPPEAPIGQNRPIFNARKVIDGIHAFRKVRWEPDAPLDPTRLKTMSEADVQILTAAAEREVSPSDIALQARLQVGRSRLSQRFNDLNRTGYLSVRTEGRSRYYRLTEAASSLFSEVNE